MSRFTEAAYVVTGRSVRGRPEVRLTSPLAYEVGFLGSGLVIEAPAGFVCDLVSQPAWTLRFAWGRRVAARLARASIPHDLMRRDRRWPKLLGDYVFFEAMGVDAAPPLLRWSAFALVLMNFRRD